MTASAITFDPRAVRRREIRSVRNDGMRVVSRVRRAVAERHASVTLKSVVFAAVSGLSIGTLAGLFSVFIT